ncbi:hypothetical protein ABL78_1438 [Leptomonas seymouri]|uniref:Methyltransferase n=1 Tax=Leptomonas seymouri TaxID=5684 RepID=A0A0N1I298_LEPSE|nr:hypothetical protein ABL78_1438 [Leptomonas seymouri]|eukprot:KPI89474.1 hypothetical protein ABL78_1438 [Leptomonas seymouri]
MDRLPPIALASRSEDCSYPRSLVLYLQCAPYNVVLAAFQADCDSRGISWCSACAQELAVQWFLQHPVAQKYPPRQRMLRALLKAYIGAIEEQRVVEFANSSKLSEDEAVQLELMAAYIELSVSGSENMRDTEMSFKTFFNPHAGGPVSPPMCACTPPVPMPPSTFPLSRVNAVNSTPSKLNTPPSELRLVDTAGKDFPPHPVDEPSPPTVPRGATDDAGDEDFQPMLKVQLMPSSAPLQPKSGSFHRPPHSKDKVLDQFCAIRVSNEQFSNVGLSLWPAAFVMAQLLAQEFKGQTHLLSDLLGLPHTSGSLTNGNGTSMPALPTPSKVPSFSISSSSNKPHVGGHSKYANIGGAKGSASGKQYSSQLRILELGAGVGLTPVFLHTIEEYRRHVDTFLATDYQDSIIDNIKFNFKENGITPVEDFTAAKRGLEGDQTPPFHCAAKLDWVNHLKNEGMFIENAVDVVLAADCIYDVDVIPALVDTIHLALTAEDISSYLSHCSRSSVAKADLGSFVSLHSSGSSKDCGSVNGSLAPTPQKKRCCIVVQTHRQNSTMQAFFSAVRKFGQVRSYSLVCQPVGALNMSADGSGIDGGCVPLGSWDAHSAMLNPDRVIFALKRDVVRGDGSLESMSRPFSSQQDRCSSAASNSLASSPGDARHTLSRTSHAATPQNVTGAGSGKATSVPTPQHSSKLNNSVDSCISFGHNLPVVTEAAESQLTDGMIGPFYTSMVGLIGVHIITLKPTKMIPR